jgi:hypothetical protein
MIHEHQRHGAAADKHFGAVLSFDSHTPTKREQESIARILEISYAILVDPEGTKETARQVVAGWLFARRFFQARGTKEAFQLVTLILSRSKTVEVSLLALDFPDQLGLGLAE